MKRCARLLSYVSALLGALTVTHPASARARAVLWLPKLVAGAWAPALAVVGGFSALVGLACRDRKTVAAGAFGAAVAARYVLKVSAPHDGFDQAFGPGWESRIPATVKQRLMPVRWTPRAKDPPEASWQRDVRVGTRLATDDPLLADIWQPESHVPRTGLAVIYLHGSGWHYGGKDFRTRHFFRHLAGQGHVIMDVAYGLAPEAQLHAMVGDVKRSVGWMKTQGKELGVNPERVILMGGSAGGHLALLTAYTANDPDLQPADLDVDTSVRAAVSFYGPPDLRALHDYICTGSGGVEIGRGRLVGPLIKTSESLLRRRGWLPASGRFIEPMDVLPNLLGGTPNEVPQLYRLGTVINRVGPDCPPTLLLQGAHDFGGMVPDVRRLHRVLLEAGVTSIYVEFPDTDHGFDLLCPRWSPAAQAATYDTERFLALMI